jgi:hypothetical protein
MEGCCGIRDVCAAAVAVAASGMDCVGAALSS